MRARSLRVEINLALGLGLLLLLLAGTGAWFTIQSFLDDEATEAQAQEAALLLQSSIAQLRAAESWQRKFLLTSDPGDLQSYQAARLAVRRGLAAVHTSQPPAEGRKLLPELERAIGQRLEAMERVVRVRQRSGLQAATAEVSSQQTRELNDRIDRLVERIKDEGSQGVQLLRSKTRDGARFAELLIAAGGLLAFGLLLWAGYLINHFAASRLRAERRLSESMAMGRAVTGIMAEGVVTADTDGTIVDVNAAGLELFGYDDLAELRGQPVARLMPERYRPGFDKLFGSVKAQPAGVKQTGLETLGLRRDGAEIAVQLAFGDVVMEGRRLFTAIIHDVTELTRMGEALRASETQMREVLDTVPALMGYVDAGQHLVFHNQAYRDSLGRSRDEIDGKTLREVLGAERYEGVRHHIDDAFAGYTVTYERSQRNRHGSVRVYEMKYFPRYGEGDQVDQVVGVYALGTDITDFKRIDRMKSEFVSTVSHELRTPLTAIRGSLGLIAGGVAGVLPDKARSLVQIANANCERLIRLINDLLDSEKIESGQLRLQLEVLPLEGLLAEVVSANESLAAQRRIRLVLEADHPKELYANIDSDRFLQVVTNLVSNAVKFSPPESEVRIVLRSADGRIRVEVHDQGPGIPAEFHTRIFQKFSQADSSDTRQKGGTGLGLNISRALVESMGGQIGFDSVPGRGTCFHFELPRSQPPGSVETASGFGSTLPGGLTAPRLRMLVCADDAQVAGLATRLFDGGGFDAESVSSAEQAFDRLAIQSYAVLAVDLKQRAAQTANLMRDLREQRQTRQLPVVLMSASADGDVLRFGDHPLVVSGWIQPPVEENRLVAGLRRAVAGLAGAAPRILHLESDQDLLRLTSLAAEPNAGSGEAAGAFAANDLSAATGERAATIVLRNRKPETYDA